MSPARTRNVEMPTVLATARAIASDVGWPILVDLSKNLPWAKNSLRKGWGGGSNIGLANPTAQHSSQMPANRPIEAIPQSRDVRALPGASFVIIWLMPA